MWKLAIFSDPELLGDVWIRQLDGDEKVGEILDVVVVGVAHHRLQGHNGVHGADEAAYTQPHGVQPFDHLVLQKRAGVKLTPPFCFFLFFKSSRASEVYYLWHYTQL